ncbi:MAG: flagellar biosynthesis anti-sigma factor FlgM [Phycisphaerales bacterium]|nr:flagellar biosynthesis anti-sigma factor FlgM [Phycisphaerae bacterium]NNF43800.1 flagellar biosynthesis anti-sigma factor FlgM [Phycisphaerales bacterium]NNM27214.1 flagellar biosynthesis anti-sigma factor FlgM [Phycisphaerales bacterium]
MADISSIPNHAQSSVGPLERAGSVSSRREAEPTNRPAAPPVRPGDRVELSDHARYLDQLREAPPIRVDQVTSIRSEIENGTYVTDAKLDQAIDALIRDLVE